jgi:chromosome transmission fidelity protein 18
MPVPLQDDKENQAVLADKPDKLIKRDFFGRIIEAKALAELDRNAETRVRTEERKVWVTYHEGLNNAVRKPISLKDFLSGL